MAQIKRMPRVRKCSITWFRHEEIARVAEALKGVLEVNEAELL